MNVNPYDAPERSSEGSAPVPPIYMPSGRAAQPIGVIVLFALHILHGLLIGGAMVLLLALGEARFNGNMGITAFVVFLTIMIGVGLFRGQNWGWRAASFYYVAQVAQPLLTMLRGGGPSPFQLVEAVVGISCFLYLFKDNVLAYFGMVGVQKVPTAARIIGVCVVLFTIMTLMD